MRIIVARSAVVVAAAAASVCFAAAAPASAAPTGPVTLSATASSDGKSIVLTYTNHLFVGSDTCVSTARNRGANGETITTNTPAPFFPPTTTVTVSPETAGLYEITFTCPAILGWGGPSSSNDTPLFVAVNPAPPGPIGGPTPFGS